MKKLTYTLALLLITSFAFAQQLDYENLVPPIDRPQRQFQDYLVQLAWINNPKFKVFAHERNIKNLEVGLARWGWTDDIFLSFNVNELNYLAAPEPVGGVPVEAFSAFPIWSFNATIRLGTIINTPKKVKMAKQEIMITDLEMYQEQRDISNEVLEAYMEYLQSIEELKLRSTTEEDTYQTYTLLASLFKEDEATFDEFNAAANSYHRAQESTLSAQNKIELAKMKIEHYIGIEFEKAELLHETSKKF